ncbi:hypothetical protein ACIOUE_38080 [Streptomyces xanthochromogenes]|uniref:hypothetical protein n=1 Tax=Streptomyces xanthochromogenes TaxID=67384 RepID=UPI00381DBDD1
MDAGVAAVCGALAGSVATIGAALATGWSQREGARISARAEHLRQRREPRHDVYKGFIAAVSEMNDATRNVRAINSPRIEHFTDEQVLQYKRAAGVIKAQWLEVALAGPKSVNRVATRIKEASNLIAIEAEALLIIRVAPELLDRHQGGRETIQGVKKAAEDLTKWLSEFTELAQAVLDSDGSKGAA